MWISSISSEAVRPVADLTYVVPEQQGIRQGSRTEKKQGLIHTLVMLARCGLNARNSIAL